MEMTSYPILHICVNYRNNEQTKSFLRNLRALSGSEKVQICLVNNSATSADDATFSEFSSQSGFRLVNAPENPGYFGAAQKAYSQMTSKVGASWVIVSNTDMRIDDAHFYEKLMALSCDSKVGVIAPQVISDLSGKNENPFLLERPSRKKMKFLKEIFSHYLTCQLYQLLGMLKAKIQARLSLREAIGIRQIYAAHGAFMIFTKNYFLSGLDFSHPCFLYGEEIHVAEKALSKGLQTLYLPDLQVQHIEHGSTGILQYLLNARVYRWKKESLEALWRTHFKTSDQR